MVCLARRVKLVWLEYQEKMEDLERLDATDYLVLPDSRENLACRA